MEKAKTEKEAHGEFEREHPGYCGAQGYVLCRQPEGGRAKGKGYWHFSSHGQFDRNDARRSGLIMKGDTTLTVGSLLDNEQSLGRPRLVVLSACETGLYDTARSPDEFVGLPSGGERFEAWGGDEFVTVAVPTHRGIQLHKEVDMRHDQARGSRS